MKTSTMVAVLCVALLAFAWAAVAQDEGETPIFKPYAGKTVLTFKVDDSLEQAEFDEGIFPNPNKGTAPRKVRMQFLHAEYTNVLNETMYGIPEDKFPIVSDKEWADIFFSKLKLWSNNTFDVAPQLGIGFERIETGLELKGDQMSIPASKRFKDVVRNIMRAKTKAKKSRRAGLFLGSILGPRSADKNMFKQEDIHESDDEAPESLDSSSDDEDDSPMSSERNYLAQVLMKPGKVLNPFGGNGSGGGFPILKNASLPCAWHEFLHNLGLGHSLRTNYRNEDGTWKFVKEYGDTLSVQGGSKYIPPIDEAGPAGVLPAQAHRMDWLTPDQFIHLTPGKTYTLRTPDAYHRTEPTALVWKDRTYGTNHWFSFWKSESSFDDDYEKEQGSNAHGGHRGWSDHALDNVAKSSYLVNQFGKDYWHQTGLHFQTLDYGDDFITVKIDYDPTKRTSWQPEFEVTTTRKSGGPKTKSSVTLNFVMLRDNIPQEKQDPFLITHGIMADCEFRKFDQGGWKNRGLIIAGGHTGKRDHVEIKSRRYRLRASLTLTHPGNAHALTAEEKNKIHYCDIYIGSKMSKARVGIQFS
ncbi:Hypothetical Protein FCC1311_075502 [Hondaea fermentalgiana]|uniref:Peptidase M6-like domain-containing protein n=1 Tax=Hondaea fermentalgiana TaxID=2315210 RepID=A0A2R5GKC0_9STRA|nr:Hypothetical Protein FCC1311_075502 [Hondaea fermentalgiana]|eukprot:GBG31327.1 Hypothetical Protein FCC1311_075502 [Hondaea fermentalgiana]